MKRVCVHASMHMSLSLPSRIQAVGFVRSYCKIFIWSVANFQKKKKKKGRVKKLLAEIVEKQQRGRKEKAFQLVQSFHTFGFERTVLMPY